jgi:hypothetical protein
MWRGRALCCGVSDEPNSEPVIPDLGEERILDAVGERQIGFVEIADKLDEVPWDVLAA